MTLTDAQRKALAPASDKARRDPCLLCRRAPSYSVVRMVPATPWEYAAEPEEGKLLVLVFGLCPACTNLDSCEVTRRTKEWLKKRRDVARVWVNP